MINISGFIMICLSFLLLPFGCNRPSDTDAKPDNIYPLHEVTSRRNSHLDSVAEQKKELTTIYSLAIRDYIRFVSKEYKLTFDTLFLGKHVYGQPDDFPDIELPSRIENTNIRLITPEQGEKKQKEPKRSFYINLMGWVDPGKADFVFVTFSNGMAHQFDVYISYKYDGDKKGFDMESKRFENFLYRKK